MSHSPIHSANPVYTATSEEGAMGRAGKGGQGRKQRGQRGTQRPGRRGGSDVRACADRECDRGREFGRRATMPGSHGLEHDDGAPSLRVEAMLELLPIGTNCDILWVRR